MHTWDCGKHKIVDHPHLAHCILYDPEEAVPSGAVLPAWHMLVAQTQAALGCVCWGCVIGAGGG